MVNIVDTIKWLKNVPYVVDACWHHKERLIEIQVNDKLHFNGLTFHMDVKGFKLVDVGFAGLKLRFYFKLKRGQIIEDY